MNGLKQASSRLNVNPASVSLLDAANIIARLKYPEPRRLDEKRRARISWRAKHIIKRYDDLIGKPYSPKLSMNKHNGTI